MFRVAISIVQDSALAEDVVQDSIIKVWDGLANWRGDGSLRSWILRIAHNTAVSTLRKIHDEAWDPAKLPDTAQTGAVESTVESRDDLVRLRDAIAELDDLSRSILVLRETEGMPYDEIAATLDITLGQVKIRLLRTRRQLASKVRGVIT